VHHRQSGLAALAAKVAASATTSTSAGLSGVAGSGVARRRREGVVDAVSLACASSTACFFHSTAALSCTSSNGGAPADVPEHAPGTMSCR
jgi:hypothetical protein